MEPCEKHEMWGCVYCTPTVPSATVHVTDVARRRSGRGQPWTDQEREIAADPTLTNEEVAELIGRKVRNVQSYRLLHGSTTATRERNQDPVERAGMHWTP